MSETRKLAAILAADVVGFSRLASADEDRTLARLRALRSDLIAPTIALHHGRVVKRTGDGILIEFRSVVDAVRCAIECQNGMIERNGGLPPEKRIEFRVGIHLGDVVEESDGDLMGDGVNIASRLEGIAKPGAIYLSEDAYRQVKARLDVAVNDVGEQKLKNITDPVRVYCVEVGKPGERAKAASAARSRLVPALGALAAILALVGATAWYWTAGRPPTNCAGAAPFGVPTVAVLPFVNVTGDPQYETLTQRSGQKMRDDASDASIWRIVGRSAGAGAADPIDAGRQLNADYVVTGNLEAGGDALRVTLQLADVHSGARLWSQTISPVLEKPNTSAAEAEVAGRAEFFVGRSDSGRRAHPPFFRRRNHENDLGMRSSRLQPEAGLGRERPRMPGGGGPKGALELECVGIARRGHQRAEGLGLGLASRGGERREARSSRRPGVAGGAARSKSGAPEPPRAVLRRRGLKPKRLRRSILTTPECWAASRYM